MNRFVFANEVKQSMTSECMDCRATLAVTKSLFRVRVRCLPGMAGSHGIGAARAMQVNADAGAYAGLALGRQVVLASLLMPLAFRLF